MTNFHVLLVEKDRIVCYLQGRLIERHCVYTLDIHVYKGMLLILV